MGFINQQTAGGATTLGGYQLGLPACDWCHSTAVEGYGF